MHCGTQQAKMSAPQRYSFATWLVTGPKGRVLVRRIAKRYWIVGWEGRPMTPGFFTERVYLKRDAIAFAERLAGNRVLRRASPENLAFLVSA